MSESSEFVFVYTTLPSMEEADRIASALVHGRLAACVNCFPGMRAFYEWQGETRKEEEVAAFIKTRRDLVAEVMAVARRLHPYEVPALLVLPIEAGNDDYLAWARAQTSA